MNTTTQTPMTQTVQELAVKYALALVQYHTARLTEPRNRAQIIEAQEQLFIVHEQLDSNSIRAAEIAAIVFEQLKSQQVLLYNKHIATQQGVRHVQVCGR